MLTQLKGFREETNSVGHKIYNQEEKLNVSYCELEPKLQPWISAKEKYGTWGGRWNIGQALQDVDKEVYQAICSIHASPYKNGYQYPEHN